MRFSRWHRLLCFLGIRNDFDYTPPGLGPEVNHPYYRHDALQCCNYCGGGRLHVIHKAPYNERRAAEVWALEVDRARSRYERAVDDWMENDTPAPPASRIGAYIEREH